LYSQYNIKLTKLITHKPTEISRNPHEQAENTTNARPESIKAKQTREYEGLNQKIVMYLDKF